MQNEDDLIGISKLAYIAVLRLSGFEVIRWCTEGGRYYFYFKRTPELTATLVKYGNGTLMVDPKLFYAELEDIKDLMHTK